MKAFSKQDPIFDLVIITFTLLTILTLCNRTSNQYESEIIDGRLMFQTHREMHRKSPFGLWIVIIMITAFCCADIVQYLTEYFVLLW